jgi:Domain of unknown function (DUF4476)
MKKTLSVLIASLFITVAAFAGWNQSRLIIKSMKADPIGVFINGNRVENNNNNIRLNDLQAGTYRVEIYNTARRGGLFGNNKGKLIYNEMVRIRQGMQTDIVINYNDRVTIEESPLDNRYPGTVGGGCNNDDGYDDRNRGWNNNDDRRRNRDYNRDRRGRNRDWNNNGGSWNSNGNPGNSNWNRQMDNQTFEYLKQSIRRESFDDNKFEIMQSVLKNNAVSSYQVKELLELMSFDSKRLQAAKYAYQFTTDRDRYFVVYDAFDFGSTKSELARYINNYRG